jgi:hypothetical protein
MTAQDHEALKDLREITEETRKIAAGVENPYDFGCRIWEIAFRLAAKSHDLMWPMWLIWGALTDWSEDIKQEEKASAEAAIVRAAHEWIALETDIPSREAYFNHWLYEELGYDRPSG